MIQDIPVEESVLSLVLESPTLAIDDGFTPELLTSERRELCALVARLKVEGGQHGYETLRSIGASEEALKIYELVVNDDLPRESFKHLVSRLRVVAANRAVHQVTKTFHERVMAPDCNALEWLAEMETQTLAIRDLGMGKEGVGGPKRGNDTGRLIEILEKAIENKGKITGLTTGWDRLDRQIDGLQPGRLYILGARPSVGKTSWMLNFVEHQLLNDRRGMVFTCEMSYDDIIQSTMHLNSNTNRYDLRDNVTQGLLMKLKAAITRMAGWDWEVDDTAGITIEKLSHEARKAHQTKPLKWLAVDYLQLMKSEKAHINTPRQVVLGHISSGLKSLSKELGIPILALAQLSRQQAKLDQAKGRMMAARPRLEHLRESGDLEQDADWVGFLHRDQESQEDDTTIITAKNRFGPLGDISLKFILEHGRIIEHYGQ